LHETNGRDSIIEAKTLTVDKIWLPYDCFPKANTKYSPSKVHGILDYSQITELRRLANKKNSSISEGKNDFPLIITATSLLLHRYARSKFKQLVVNRYDVHSANWLTSMISTSIEQHSTFEQHFSAIETSISVSVFDEKKSGKIDANFQLRFVDLAQSEDLDSNWYHIIDNFMVSPDLDLLVVARKNQLELQIVFNQNCFELTTIERFLNHFRQLLTFNTPDTPIKNLAILSETEKQWLEKVGTGASHHEQLTTIAYRFEQYELSQPHATAVQYKTTQLSYRELNGLANQLSHYLIQCGFSKQAKVIVFVEPSIHIMVSILAIFKIGGVYIPLDPSFPADRIKIIMEDVSPDIVLTQQKLANLIHSSKTKLIELDASIAKFSNQSELNLNLRIDPQLTASIFYTSGTTGKPKGVMASYANINHYINVAYRKYGFNSSDSMPAIARFTFSISLFELLLPIASGGKTLVLDREHILDLDDLTNTLQDVSFAHIGPSLLKAVVAQIKSQRGLDFHNLRHISSGGDMIPAELVRDLQSLFPKAEIYLIYGCSEISCMGVTYFVDANQVIKKTYVGKPFENVKVRIVDENLNRVAQGCIGNVCFAGQGLVKGYLNLPELSEQKFFLLNKERFYNTGDRGRLNRKGDLELLGREDFQVQIRGVRIELGEIEFYLRQVKGIKDAVVSQLISDNKDPSLVGYVVIKNNSRLDRQQIRGSLLKKLPDYMVPSQYVFLEKLPLNHNLKVDRKALPRSIIPTEKKMVSAKTKTQKTIIALWKNLLEIKQIGIQTDFFEVGGDSLLLTQLRTKIGKTFGVTLPLSLLFRHTTIEDLALVIDSSSLQEFSVQPDIQLASSTKNNRLETLGEMSFAQQRLWYLEQLNPGTPLYNIPIIIKLAGQFGTESISQFFKYFCNKHDSLRTSLTTNESPPKQMIHSNINISINTLNFNNKTESEVHRYLENESIIPFKLTEIPLFRINLLKLGNDEAILFLVIHHIIFDAWSLDILLSEFKMFFGLSNEEKHDHLQASRLDIGIFQYSDYAQWQNRWIKGGGVEQQLNLWLDKLAGELPVLRIPEQKSRATIQSTAGATETISLSKEISARVLKKSRQKRVTPFMYFLTVYVIALYRYSDQQDIIIGTPMANRNIEETESMVGFFINTLPIRIKIDDRETFLSLLDKVKTQSLFGFDNQDIPFESLVAKLNPKRDPSRTPIFQTIFNYLKIVEKQKISDNLSIELPIWNEIVSKMDLSLIVRETTNNYHLSVEYCTDLFDKKFIRNFIANLSILLEDTLNRESIDINSLKLLSGRQENELVLDRNQTEKTFDPNENLLNRFVQHCHENPNKVAIITDEKKITYLELSQRSKILANQLVKSGVQPNDIVAVLLSRSEKLVISILAIFSTGASYLPLDPEYPRERIHYILDDSGITHLVLENNFSDLVNDQALQLIDIDQALSEKPIENKRLSIESPLLKMIAKEKVETLAYVIYTSGSTGNPKGVMVTQHNLSNFLASMSNRPGLTTNDILLAVTTISFDIAVLEILLPLFVGASTIVVNRLKSYDPSEISQLLVQHDVTLMQATPATWQMLLDSNWLGKNDLRALVGGEALSQSLSFNLFNKVAEVWNMYGPTETTIWSTCYRIKSDQDKPKIGTPIDNTQVYILNDHMHLVAEGVEGELCIGGKGVTQGYLGKPDLTKEKYVNNPFSKTTPSFLYKTGDKVRYDLDGNIEYIGRTDFQVKVRGYRIELGEIETRINQLDTISQSVVMVREDHTNDQRLVAYFIKKDDQTPNIELLKEHIKDALPLYMLPHNFVELDAFPLTPNGKIDRKAFPLPKKQTKSVGLNNMNPTSETEKKIAEIWQTLIGEDIIGVNDIFFDLGGHSLLALQAISQVKKQFGFELTPLMMIRETLQQIAARVDGKDISKLTHMPSEQNNEILVPFIFGSKDSLFGILNKPISNTSAVGAVLLCSPLYTENINTHWAFKRLASQLTQQGYHVLRFDYSGTGDSWGDDGCFGATQWIDDLKIAAAELSQLTSHEFITVVGFRFGATLAAHAECEIIDKLILWEPIVSGKKYVDELIAKYHQTIEDLNIIRKRPATAVAEEIVGYHFPNEVRDSISQLNLIRGPGLKKASCISLVTSSENASLVSLEQQLLKINKLFRYYKIDTHSPTIESYTNLDAYLPTKSINVIVDIIKGQE